MRLAKIFFLVSSMFLAFNLNADTNKTDICYDSIIYDGTCKKYGNVQGGINCRQTIPLHNISDEALTHVQADINTTGITGNLLGECGIDNNQGNCSEKSDIDMGAIGILSKGISYEMPDFNIDSSHSTYDRALMGVAIFSGQNLYVTYTKENTVYHAQINACGVIPPSAPEDETIPNGTANLPASLCDTFADGLQTRGDDSKVDFSGGNAKLYNNPDTTLNTYHTPTNGGSGNNLTCMDNKNGSENQACQATNVGATTIQGINQLYPALFTFPSNDTTGGQSIEVGNSTWGDDYNSGDELDAYVYNSVTAHGGVSPNHLNFKVTNQLKLGTLQTANGNNVTFTSKTGDNFEMVATTIHTKPSNRFTADSLVKNIKIKTAEFGDTNRVNLTAEQTIKIDELKTNHSSNYNLTAPYVNINKLTDVSGVGRENNINIKADYIDIGTLDIGDATTLTITPLTPNKDVLVNIDSLSTGSNNILNFSKGTYYIKHLDTSGSGSGYRWNMVNGKVNLILEDDWNSDSQIAINADHSGGDDLATESHSATNLFIYSKGNITTKNDTRIVGTIYSEKDITLNSASYIKGALSAKDLISLSNGTKVYYDQAISDEGMGQCQANTESFLTGPFDAWDVSINSSSTPPSITDRNITTKVVNTTFSLSLASLNETNDAYKLKKGDGNVSVSIYSSGSPISNSIIFHATTTDHNSPVYFNVTKADKNARVGFKFCATYDKTTGLTLHKLGECSSILYDCNTTTTGNNPKLRICYSTDNFAIRPYSFRVFGKNQYKRAGEDFNVTIKGVDQNNNSINSGTVSDVKGVSDYNASLSDLSIVHHIYQPSLADITQMKNDTNETDVTACPQAGVFTKNNPSDLFSNGEINASLKFSETGILDLNISEISGHEWAQVDENDTNDSQRYIKPATVHLLFIPYKFNTNATYETTNGKNWIYMNSDINDSATARHMAAYIKYTITAKNRDGNVTQNYTKSCFPDINDSAPQVNGMKMNTTFDLFLDADINSSADANISLYSTEGDASSANLVKEKNTSLSSHGNNKIQEWISPLGFTNGVGKAKVYFNIDRNISIARNPMTIGVLDANTSRDKDPLPKEFNGGTINKSKTFIYGRTHAPRQRFTGNHGNAFIYYEVYCNGTDDYNVTCNKSMLPNGGDSNSSDDPRWFINSSHQTTHDGNINSFTQIETANTVTSATPTGANPDRVSLTYDKSKGYPYKTTMETNASNWFIYNKYDSKATTNESQVEFIDGNATWSGAHETNTTTVKGGTSITNRRVMW